MKTPLFLLTLSTFLGAALSFLVQLLLARSLEPASYGIFYSSLTIINVLTPLAGFGVSAYWLKAFGEEGWMAIRWIKPSLQFTVLSLLGVLLALFCYVFFIENDNVVRQLLLVMSVLIVGQISVELVGSLLQLEEKYLQLSMWQFSPHLLRFFVIVILLSMGIVADHSALSVGWGFTFVAVVLLLSGIRKILQSIQGNLSLVGHGERNIISSESLPSVYDVFKNALPFGLAGFFYLLYFQSNIVIVNNLLSSSDAGLYGVMLTVLTAIYLFPAIIYNKFLLPKIHRWAYQDKRQFVKVYKKGNIIMFTFGCLAAFVVMIFSSYVVPLLFGMSYSVVGDLLFFAAFAIPFRFLASSLGAFLVTKDNMRLKVIAMGITAIVSVIVNFWMISIYGLQGAALSVIFVDAFLCSLYYVLVRVCVFRNSRV